MKNSIVHFIPFALTSAFLLCGCNSILYTEVKDYHKAHVVDRTEEEWQEYWEAGRWEDEEVLVNGVIVSSYIHSRADYKVDIWKIEQSFITKEDGIIVKVNDIFVRTESGTDLEVAYQPSEILMKWDENLGYYNWFENEFAQFELDFENDEALTLGINVTVTNQGKTITETREYTFYPKWREHFNLSN
ncbi:hypothetical protein IPG41_04965 [Candidatus Peregrinibacteria bacterium]|nr:MAG: hypothetical protein IPG41_04965 [Candidatus Peregrinibacteria bacterium]